MGAELAPPRLVSPPAAVRRAATLFEVVSPRAFREAGAVREAPEPRQLRALLAQRIYQRCHLHGASRTSQPAVDERADGVPALAQVLARLADRTYADRGWRVAGPRGDRIVVERDGLHLIADPNDVDPGAHAAEAGADVWLRVPVMRPVAQPGFLVAFSPHGPPAGEGAWRLYLHPREDRAGDVFLWVFDALGGRGLRFQAKVLRRHSLFVRPDALVVFLARRDLAAALAVAEEIPREWLAAPTPGFARRIGRGIAIAPEPDGPLSYGQHASEWAASGLVAAWREGASDAHDRLRVMLAQRSQRPWEAT
jgi:hypothetical protein